MLTLSTWLRMFRSSPKAKSPVKRHRRRVRPSIEMLEDRSLLSTVYTVTSLADTNTPGTLRYEINQANANHTGTAASPDQIQFAVSGGTISVNAADGGALGLASNEVAVIDGTTATGYNGTPVITLDGTQAGVAANGLTISGGSSTVKGLDIVNFSGNGIQLDTNGHDTVQSCYIGITTQPAVGVPVWDENGANGIFIDGTAGNTIGGQQSIAGNIISGNYGNGILIEGATASNNVVVGNFIGTDATGSVAVGNGGNGIEVENAPNNQIGPSNPVSPVTYYNTSNFPSNPQATAWQGLRGGDSTGQYLITGTDFVNKDSGIGVLYEGTIDGSGTSYAVNYPGAAVTSVYGPNNLGGGVLQLVGSYRTSTSTTVNGFIFQGTTSDLTNASDYATIDMPGAQYNFVHSTMGGLAVGNYDSPADHGKYGLPLGPGHAFLFDVSDPSNPKYITDISFPGAISNTAYGIWYNGGTSYTIAGGYSFQAVNNFQNQHEPLGHGYLVDYDSSTGTFSHWTSFDYPYGTDFLTHFEGISSTQPGVYTISADAGIKNASAPAQGAWMTVSRNADGSFGTPRWVNLNYPGFDPTTHLTSDNSVYGNQVVGIIIGHKGHPYQATVNTSAVLSNVISGNGGNGILIEGAAATDNAVVDNNIGTNEPGTAALGNTGNGIEITNGARLNTIGGDTPTTGGGGVTSTSGSIYTATHGGGVTPTTSGNITSGGPTHTSTAFVGKPPDGNVISANGGNGVYITGGATYNTLSGNFIGTDVTGTHAFGNTLNGVAIVDADNNSLIGTTVTQKPFVYLNLVSGNGENGLVIDNSNNTTVQANSFGLADDNATALGNRGDGVLIEGTSKNTQFGGVIPLGNITAGNGRNGVEIADSASGTVVFNTFCGLPAFVDTAVGNALDGILVTSTGGNNLIRTNVISGNGSNGVHISGDASGVQVSEDIIGMDTKGALPLPNGANGVLIDGDAHDNLIGGNQVSVVLQNTISSNGGNGIAIEGNAYDNKVFHSFIGTDITGVASYGNAGAGVFIGGSAQDNTIGGTSYFTQNVISGNLGGGIQLSGESQGTQVIGNLIGTDRNGRQALDNHGDGIWIVSSNNQIGGVSAGMGNVIAFNSQDGIVVDTGSGNALLGNSIFSNAALGIRLLDGGNDNQPAPLLTAAEQLTSTTVQITGALTAAANTTYTLEFFATPSSTPPAQGQNFLGSLSVTTNANGFVSFVFSPSLSTPAGASFTATATDPANNTSPFSNAVFAVPPTPPSPPMPPPTPVGRLTPFGFGFGPGLQLEILDVDTQGQVFAQALGAIFFGGTPTFVNSDVVFSNVQLLNGLLFGFLQNQSNQQELVEIWNFVNPFVFNAILTALMKPV